MRTTTPLRSISCQANPVNVSVLENKPIGNVQNQISDGVHYSHQQSEHLKRERDDISRADPVIRIENLFSLKGTSTPTPILTPITTPSMTPNTPPMVATKSSFYVPSPLSFPSPPTPNQTVKSPFNIAELPEKSQEETTQKESPIMVQTKKKVYTALLSSTEKPVYKGIALGDIVAVNAQPAQINVTMNDSPQAPLYPSSNIKPNNSLQGRIDNQKTNQVIDGSSKSNRPIPNEMDRYRQTGSIKYINDFYYFYCDTCKDVGRSKVTVHCGSCISTATLYDDDNENSDGKFVTCLRMYFFLI